jgi:hypothetical protein
VGLIRVLKQLGLGLRMTKWTILCKELVTDICGEGFSKITKTAEDAIKLNYSHTYTVLLNAAVTVCVTKPINKIRLVKYLPTSNKKFCKKLRPTTFISV